MTSDRSGYVWVWLPGRTEPVAAGRIDSHPGEVTSFTYGRSYRDNPDAIPLYLPELPLRPGPIPPRSGEIAGCLADAGPDAWGRRVIEYRTGAVELRTVDYLFEAGSDRIGALDFQQSPDDFQPRGGEPATLEELRTATELLEEGRRLSPALTEALIHGSSIGGARPKALLLDPNRPRIAKFSSSTDTRPVVGGEHAAMRLARLAGLDVATTELIGVLGKAVLLIDRFDRTADGARRLMVSAQTILELHDAYGMAGRYATYHDLADRIRARFTDPDVTLRELFSRITFNILCGNTDDHARNQAAFWDGADLTLTPAFDICPQPRAGGEATQAMAYGPGARFARAADCLPHAGRYHLSENEARSIIDKQIDVIRTGWDEVADEARLTRTDRSQLWEAQFLNPFALQGY